MSAFSSCALQIPYDNLRGFLLGVGISEWQADGIVELTKLVNEDTTATNSPQGPIDVEAILGRPPTTAVDWVKQVAPAFK